MRLEWKQIDDYHQRARVEPLGWLVKAVENVAHQLTRADVDYTARREAARCMSEVPASAMTGLLPCVGSLWTSERGRHGATWIWTEWAGGDAAASPAMLSTDWAATPESRRDGWRVWRKWAPVELKRALLTMAPDLVTR